MSTSRSLDILAADVMRGDVLVHFCNGESVLFRASFLEANKAQSPNVIMPKPDQSDELFVPPEETLL